MTALSASAVGRWRFGLLAYVGAAISLVFCFWKASFGVFAPAVGLAYVEIDPHLQAAAMWLFAAATVFALYAERRRHGDFVPLAVGVLALAIIIGTLYGYYHDVVLATGYGLLLIAAFLNQNRMLAFLYRRIEAQAAELQKINSTLEQRVSAQVAEIEKLARLKRFLPGEVADLVTSEGNEQMLESHRRYIACLFCDIRRFTAMTEAMEPEDVMEVLHRFHEAVGKLVVSYRGTIGYRAGDGVMVCFNDPIPCDRPDLQAAKLALDLRRAFEDLRGEWQGLDVDVGLGIGIAGGYATLGVIGVEGRYDYTAIGGSVNLAARLSDQAEDGDILLSRRSQAAVEQSALTRPLEPVTLKGFSQPVEAWLLDGLRDDA